MKMKRGAIWVSTVLYVLISITILSIVFSVVKPKIDEARDRAVIEQSIIMLNDLDNAVNLASQSTGTQLKREIKISAGDLYFNSTTDPEIGGGNVSFILKDTNLKYSEIGTSVKNGNILITTMKNKQKVDRYDISLTLEINIQKNVSSRINQLSQSPFPYSLFIQNNGTYINFYKE